MTKWILRENDANIELMSQTLKIKPVTAYVLANRGIRTKNTAVKYLNPDISFMHDAKLFKDIDKAVCIINESIKLGEKLAVYGDYDVDGVMSAVILVKALKRFNADVTYYIPHREEEGYGLSLKTADKLNALGIKLVIACDNGIAAADEIAYMKNLGMKVIVIDHHEPGFMEDADGSRQDIVPDADAIINPKQKDCAYPFKALCAAGICYKFAKYFYQYNNYQFDSENEDVVLAAIATFCDIVDLTDENRIIAKRGLTLLNGGQYNNIGLQTLIRQRQLENKKIDSFEIGFIIGPCINATGRLESAEISAELFLAQTQEEADLLAQRLVELNENRKTLTAKAVENILLTLEQSDFKNDKVLVIYSEEIHESIAGIVAGRIKEATNRPTIILTRSGDLVKGSARSIEFYNIFEALHKCRDLFERFGGHPMAAGLSLKEENVQTLRKRLNADCDLEEKHFEKTIYADKELDLDDVTYELAKELKLLEPFGKENKEPVFLTKGLTAVNVEIIGETRKTMRFTFTLESGRKLKGICFGKVDQFLEMIKGKYSQTVCDNFAGGKLKSLTVGLNILYCIEINEFNNNTYVQLKIIDFIV